MTIALGANVSDLERIIDASLPVHREGLAIVFYHVDQPADHPFMRYQGQTKPDYHGAIGISVRHAHAVHPDAQIIMLTDQGTQFDNTLPMTLARLPVASNWLMYERTRAQLAFTKCWKGHAIHIDTDVVIQHSFAPAFAEPFDFALTARDEIPGQHINGGMLLCKTPPKFAKFLEDMLDLYDSIAESANRGKWAAWDYRGFRGGQLSLSVLMHDKRASDTAWNTSWGLVRIFDSEQINQTFRPPALAVHFKGPRKAFMRLAHQ